MTEWLQRVRDLEPARVRAVWAAMVALLVAVGVTVNTDLDAAVSALIVAVFTVLPLVQGESTRSKVVPVSKLEEAMLQDEGVGHGSTPDDILPGE